MAVGVVETQLPPTTLPCSKQSNGMPGEVQRLGGGETGGTGTDDAGARQGRVDRHRRGDGGREVACLTK